MNWSGFEDYNGDDKSNLQRLFKEHALDEPQQKAILDYIKSYAGTAFAVGLCVGFVVGMSI